MQQLELKKEGDINQSDERQRWQAERLDRASRDLLEADARYFLHQAMSTPCLNALEGCDGIYLQDLQGRRYMDFHGNNVHQLGYGHPHLVARLRQQLDELPFCPRRYTSQVAVDCARRLTELAPGDLNRVLFAPGGTSVIGMALKLARLVTGRHKVVSLWDSFHGASMDAIAVGGTHSFEKGLGPLLPGVERIPPPTRYRGPFASQDDDLAYADYLEYVLEKDPQVGVFLAETVRNTDAQIPSRAYWQRVREICDRHGVLLVLDEIPIALGRTGTLFACERYGIEPDILCIGKGLGGGIVPFAAMLARDGLNIAEDVSLGHYTHEKSPLGCAAALATLDVIEQEDLLAKVQDHEQFMAVELKRLARRFALIGDVRGVGLLWGLELVKDRKTRERASDEADAVMYACLDAGLSFKVSQGNVLQLSPPLIITRDQLGQAIAMLERALEQVSHRFGYSH
ncbi:aspartate aminotransferase family protein [Marinobacterium nitratireducens]|uniref:Aspartate aminotransferase family protein n=1 Tax=Marinobacterium nitratireducens TaxID=518897 RepID=A0A917ZHN6_9GAMM|nr:aspartate aminotransferase family protein [Marinobacterium nitratireducens]GGO82309.1 aspartate aminotransferase family protein [Marinobacterium nitratireducens]